MRHKVFSSAWPERNGNTYDISWEWQSFLSIYHVSGMLTIWLDRRQRLHLRIPCIYRQPSSIYRVSWDGLSQPHNDKDLEWFKVKVGWGKFWLSRDNCYRRINNQGVDQTGSLVCSVLQLLGYFDVTVNELAGVTHVYIVWTLPVSLVWCSFIIFSCRTLDFSRQHTVFILQNLTWVILRSQILRTQHDL